MELSIDWRRITGPSALLGAAVLFLLFALYYTGTITRLGHEEKQVTSSRYAASSGFVSGPRLGSGFGLKHMLFFAGQTFYVDYDVTLNAGSFRIVVAKHLTPVGGGPRFVERIEQSGRGELTYVIPETGVYYIRFEGSPLGGVTGRGYDVAYEVTWGAR